jgi:hypothetical protein
MREQSEGVTARAAPPRHAGSRHGARGGPGPAARREAGASPVQQTVAAAPGKVPSPYHEAAQGSTYSCSLLLVQLSRMHSLRDHGPAER